MKKNKTINILFYIFVYVNLIICMIITFPNWSNFIDNGQIMKAILIVLANVFSFLFTYFTIDVILHELGHLVLGKLCNWRIYSFNILGISIVINKKKISFHRVPLGSVAGYVEMAPRREEQNIILPMLGGIIVNILLCILSIIILFNTNNIYIICLFIATLFSNLLHVIVNSIPFTPTAISKSDMYSLIEMRESIKNKTFKYYIKFIELYNLLEIKKIKDIDDSYFCLDAEEACSYVELLHLSYIDKVISTGNFALAEEIIRTYLDSKNINENNKTLLTFYLLFCMVMNKADKKEIKRIFNSDRICENIKNIEYAVAIELYTYFSIIDKNSKKANYYKNIIDKKIKNSKNRYEKETLEELLVLIKQRQES